MIIGLGGTLESGKTTMAEAIYEALFQKYEVEIKSFGVPKLHTFVVTSGYTKESVDHTPE